LLLGNNGRCFECGHAHGQGDRCVSPNIREEAFGEIAAGVASIACFRFPAASLPPTAKSLPLLQSEELALRLVELVVAALANDRRSGAAPTAREARRVLETIRFIEADVGRPTQLRDLAGVAGMSKFHFLRVFRRLTGVTPHQYVISARMRLAALGLVSSRRPVLAIALDSGFGDLSTFNHRFRKTFGVTPTRYRASFA
jgi:AraC family transcriptional regulator